VDRPLLPWAIVLGFTILAGVWVRAAIRDRGVYEIWADRDLSRAAAVAREPQFLGAEFDGGGRTPGGFYYLLLAGARAIGPSPSVVHAFTIALDVLALAALGLSARRNIGTAAGLATAAFQAAAPPSLELLRTVAYNPTLALPFGVVAYALFLDVLIRGVAWRLPFAFLAIALAAQIHFSYALLAPLFAAALLLRRVRLGWRPWAAAVLVYVAAYAPYLVADARAGWKDLREIRMRQAVVASSATVFLRGDRAVPVEVAVENVARALFGFTAPIASPVHVAGWTLYRIGAWRVFPMVLVAAFAIDRVRRLRRRDTSAPAAARAGAAMAVLIAGGVLLVAAKNASFVPRYLMFLLPAGAILYGSAFQAYADALAATRASIHKTILNVVLLYWAAVLGNANTLAWYALVPTPTLTVSGWKGLIAELQDRFRFDRGQLDRRVMVLDRATGRWNGLPPTHSAAAYLVDTFADGRPGATDARCALVLAAHPLDGAITAADVKAVLAAFPPGAVPAQTRTVSADGRRTIVEYRLADGNCLHGMNDRYVLTPEERTIEVTAGDGVTEVGGGSDRRFVFVLRSRSRGRGRWPLRAMVEVATGDGVVSAVLHSNELRGYDGISAFHVMRPAIVLRGDSGEWRIPIFEGTLGGWFTPALAPWRSAAVKVPPGAYEAFVTFADVAFTEAGPSEGPRSVLLSRRFEVPPPNPPLRATPARSRALPAGPGTPAR
jgi:hypothetical protein